MLWNRNIRFSWKRISFTFIHFTTRHSTFAASKKKTKDRLTAQKSSVVLGSHRELPCHGWSHSTISGGGSNLFPASSHRTCVKASAVGNAFFLTIFGGATRVDITSNTPIQTYVYHATGTLRWYVHVSWFLTVCTVGSGKVENTMIESRWGRTGWLGLSNKTALFTTWEYDRSQHWYLSDPHELLYCAALYRSKADSKHYAC